MLTTRYKSKLPSFLTYPIGAEALSDSLEGVPQFSQLELTFHHWEIAYLMRDRLSRPYSVMSARYRNLSPGVSGGNRDNYYEETWSLTVYAVPSGVKSIVRALLSSEGLPAIRSWLSAKRDPVWLYGRKELTLKFDELKQCLVMEECAS